MGDLALGARHGRGDRLAHGREVEPAAGSRPFALGAGPGASDAGADIREHDRPVRATALEILQRQSQIPGKSTCGGGDAATRD